MSGINKVILIGRLGHDVVLNATKSGLAVANVAVATSVGRGDEQKTEWHKVTLFDRQASFANEFLRKGSKVYIEGRLQTRDFEDKEGNTRSVTEVVAYDLQGLDPAPKND